MARGVFVTGTDTGIGKTEVTCALVEVLAARGARVAAMKPVASGIETDGTRSYQPDVAAISAVLAAPPAPADLAPYVLERPAAPEFAANDEGVTISLDVIARAYQRLARDADLVVVEGVGGWAVPLGPATDLVHLVNALDLEVVMVVGLTLGCINHARLTARALEADGVRFSGWVSNACDPGYADGERTIVRLERDIAVPRLGHLPYKSGDPGQTPPADLGGLVAALLKSRAIATTG